MYDKIVRSSKLWRTRNLCRTRFQSQAVDLHINIINKIYISVIQTYDNKIHWHVHSRGVITITAFCNKLNVFCYV